MGKWPGSLENLVTTVNRLSHSASPHSTRQPIALLIHSLQGGGAERVMSQLANRWCRQHEIHLITWSQVASDHYPLEPAVIRHGLNLQVNSQGFFGGILANGRRVLLLRKTLIQINPRLVLSFCDQMNIVGLEAMRGLPPVPVWIAEHSDPEQQRLSPLWETWRRRNYPRCTGCVALTDSIAEYMTRWVPPARLRVIPTAIPTDSTVPTNYQIASTNDLNTVLFVGRLSPEKRVDHLLKAWALVEPQLANWRLLIVGDGPLRTTLEQNASQLRRVEFLGWHQQPQQIMATSQIFVLPSIYEGFPVAMLEAMYCGLPTIATNCSSAINQLQSLAAVSSDAGGTFEAIKVVPIESAQQLAQAIVDIAQAPQRRLQMSQASRSVALQFTWETIGPKWDAVLY